MTDHLEVLDPISGELVTADANSLLDMVIRFHKATAVLEELGKTLDAPPPDETAFTYQDLMTAYYQGMRDCLVYLSTGTNQHDPGVQ